MKIMKSFSFCYGHRVWNQELSNGALCKCRFNHGHTGRVDLVLTAPFMVRGMVVDFNELKVVKNFIDSYIDHKMLCDVDDPLVQHYLKMLNVTLDNFKDLKFGCVLSDHHLEGALKEFGESLLLINFVPTSENLSRWMVQCVRRLLHGINEEIYRSNGRKIEVESVRWYESDFSWAEASGAECI